MIRIGVGAALIVSLTAVLNCPATAGSADTYAKYKNADIAWKKGKKLVDEDKKQQALTCFALALKLNPDHLWAHLDRGTTYQSLRNMPAAMQDFKESIRINQNDGWGAFHYAKQLHKEKKIKEAIEYYSLAVKREPKQYWFHYDKARAQIAFGQYREAIAELNTDVKLDQYRPQAYAARAEAWEKLGKKELAAEDHKEAEALYTSKVVPFALP